jgi:general secretion pathway protein D
VPVVGSLFGSKSKATSRSETIVMITPTVIENYADLEAATDEMRKGFTRIPPIKVSENNKD